MFKNLFSVPIFHGKLDNWKKYNRDLLPVCHEVRKETEDMSELPWNCHVWSSYAYDDQLFKRPEFQEISKVIAKYVRAYMDKRQWKGEAKMLMTELWVNYQEKYQYQEYHDHIGGSLVAVYFFKSKNNSSTFNIKKPYEKDSKEFPTGDHTSFESKEGRLLIFNSSIRHCVSQHLGKENRISFSFNYVKND